MAKSPIDRGAPASVIAGKFGGMYRFSRAMGLAPSTVHRWLVNGYIPGGHQPRVMEVARTENVKLKPVDFVDARTPAKRAEDLAAAGLSADMVDQAG